jgi:hypothetical protein
MRALIDRHEIVALDQRFPGLTSPVDEMRHPVTLPTRSSQSPLLLPGDAVLGWAAGSIA